MRSRRPGRRRRRFTMEVLEGRQLLSSVFRVTSSADDGSTGTLRWAINQVNADATDSVASPDRIVFGMPTTDPGYANGVWSISVKDLLNTSGYWPAVTRPAVIDGYTQSGSQPNTAGPEQADNAVIAVRLDGTQYKLGGSYISGLILQAPGCTVQGLSIGGFSGANLVGFGVVGG